MNMRIIYSECSTLKRRKRESRETHSSVCRLAFRFFCDVKPGKISQKFRLDFIKYSRTCRNIQRVWILSPFPFLYVTRGRVAFSCAFRRVPRSKFPIGFPFRFYSPQTRIGVLGKTLILHISMVSAGLMYNQRSDSTRARVLLAINPNTKTWTCHRSATLPLQFTRSLSPAFYGWDIGWYGWSLNFADWNGWTELPEISTAHRTHHSIINLVLRLSEVNFKVGEWYTTTYTACTNFWRLSSTSRYEAI